MKVSDFIVRVYDKNFQDLGPVPTQYLEGAIFAPRMSGVGAWKLHLPSVTSEGVVEIAGALMQPGSRIVVSTYPWGDMVLSGPVTGWTKERTHSGEKDVFEGVTDETILDGGVAYPDPRKSFEEQEGTPTLTTDGLFYILSEYVDFNIGVYARDERRIGARRDLSHVRRPSLGAGPDTTVVAEPFENLMVLCRRILAGTDYVLQVRQNGTELWPVIKRATDYTDAAIELRSGRLVSEKMSVNAPTTTKVIVRSDTSSAVAEDVDRVSEWGIPRELYSSGSGNANELSLRALNLLSEGTAQSSFAVDPSSRILDDMRFILGADLTVRVNGEDRQARCTQVVYAVSLDGVSVGVTLGDDAGNDWEDSVGTSVDSLSRRVGSIERAIQPTDSGQRVGQYSPRLTDLDDAIDAGWYVGEAGATENLPSQDSIYWFVEVRRMETGQVIQTAQPHALEQARYVRRASPDGVFTPWVPMQLAARDRNLAFQAGVTIGNGTGSIREWVADGVLTQRIDFKGGSSTQVTGDIHVYIGWGDPASPTIPSGSPLICGEGRVLMGGNQYVLQVLAMGNIVYLRPLDTSSGYARTVTAGPGAPAAWGTGFTIQATWSIPLT